MLFRSGSNGYSVLATHMLDMFRYESAGDETPHWSSSLMEQYRHFDLSGLESMDYEHLLERPLDSVVRPRVPFYVGGLRQRSFGTSRWLSKHAFFDGRRISHLDYHMHFVRRAALAEISGVLYHFLFTDWFVDKCREIVRLGLHYGHGSD